MALEIGSLIIQGTLWIKKKISVEDKQKIWQKKECGKYVWKRGTK